MLCATALFDIVGALVFAKITQYVPRLSICFIKDMFGSYLADCNDIDFIVKCKEKRKRIKGMVQIQRHPLKKVYAYMYQKRDFPYFESAFKRIIPITAQEMISPTPTVSIINGIGRLTPYP